MIVISGTEFDGCVSDVLEEVEIEGVIFEKDVIS